MRIQLAPSQIEDLRTVASLGSVVVSGVAAQFADSPEPLLSPTRLIDFVGRQTQIGPSGADSLVSAALGIRSLMRQARLTIDEALLAVQDAQDKAGNWTDKDADAWRDVTRAFREFLSLPTIANASAAHELSFDYAHLLREARILTDIRPIFDGPATSIEGAVVSHTLRVTYRDSSETRSLSIAMDEADVHELSTQCVRALTKARTAAEAMSNAVGVPTYISGEENDG
jgi:hypothetical protein